MTRWGQVCGSLVAAMALVVMAGCSGGEHGSRATDPPPGSTPAAPTTTSTSTLAPPVLPAAARQPTSKGAEAFFRYFWEVYGYGYLSLELNPIKQISAASCVFCGSVKTHILEMRLDNRKGEGGRVRVVTAMAAPGDASTGILVTGIINQESGLTRSRDGVVVDRLAAIKDAKASAVVKWGSHRWLMYEMQLQREGGR